MRLIAQASANSSSSICLLFNISGEDSYRRCPLQLTETPASRANQPSNRWTHMLNYRILQHPVRVCRNTHLEQLKAAGQNVDLVMTT